MATPAEFAQEYEKELIASIKRKPEEYMYGVEEAPAVAKKMIEAMKEGTANVSTTAKRVAKRLGVKPTMVGIKLFLNEVPS